MFDTFNILDGGDYEVSNSISNSSDSKVVLNLHRCMQLGNLQESDLQILWEWLCTAF